MATILMVVLLTAAALVLVQLSTPAPRVVRVRRQPTAAEVLSAMRDERERQRR